MAAMVQASIKIILCSWFKYPLRVIHLTIGAGTVESGRGRSQGGKRVREEKLSNLSLKGVPFSEIACLERNIHHGY